MIHSFWTSVFWPYFQFAVFLVVLIYFARKPIHNFLESKRSDFRTKLSEAHQALILAERKIKQYETQIQTLSQQIELIENQYKQNIEIEQKRILDEANATSNSILNDAKRAALELIAKTQNELKEEMFKRVLQEFEAQLTSERLAALEAKFHQDAIVSIPNAFHSHDSQKSLV